MSAITFSEAPTTGLGRLITDNRFYVPTHQRDYKWDRDRVQTFIDDLTDALDRGDNFYFVGLMVFMKDDDGRLRVLDGQQRLATTIILLSAVRAWFATADSQSDMSARIQYDFIGRAEYGELTAQPKLSLNRNNDDRFQAYVTSGSPLDAIRADLKKVGRNESDHDLLDAISYCHLRIAEKAQGFGDASKRAAYLASLIKFVRDSVVVVRLTVPNESNAFRVFETLNDRGMDLSAVDLLKNYLFGLAYDQSPNALNQLEHRWSQLTQSLQGMRQEDFLKVYWTSRYGLVQLDEIFDAVKASAKTAQDAATLSIDMLEASESYAALDDPDDPVWSGQTPATKELIGRLKILGSKLVRPAILSGLKKLPQSEFEKLLRVLEVVVVRWQVVGEGRTGTIERQSARLAQQIWSGKIKARSEMIEALSEIYTSDDDFRQRFAAQENLTRQKAILLLRRIEQHERQTLGGSNSQGLAPNASLSLEHVLPQNPDSAWDALLLKDTELGKRSTRTGNFCLLPPGVNKDLGNATFDKKKKTYSESDLLTTKQLAKYIEWTSSEIDDRQQWLAARAVAVWRLD